MFRFPFYGYPYNYPYYKYYNKYPNNDINYIPTEKEEKNSITNSTEISNTINSRSSSEKEDQAIFEIFGIKLYLDDLIIFGLLFFLYQQNVQDEMLYMILFLLLFS